MQNPGKLIKAMTAVQANVTKIQKELAETQFEGKAGGGLVKVVVTGKGEAVSANIDAEVLKEDAETVADLFVAAFNDAANQKEALAKDKFKSVAGGLLPAGIALPNLF